MKNKFSEITKHINNLEDHGHLYMYYGVPYSEECYVYGYGEDEDEYENENENENENEEKEYLIVSSECHDLCTTIAETFGDGYKWNDILKDSQIRLDDIFQVDVEAQNLTVIISLLLYLVVSVTIDDRFIEALNNGYLIRLLKRLEQLS